MTEKVMTNKEFADGNKDFQDACAKADIKPTAKQASKWRRKFGLAALFKGSELGVQAFLNQHSMNERKLSL